MFTKHASWLNTAILAGVILGTCAIFLVLAAQVPAEGMKGSIEPPSAARTNVRLPAANPFTETKASLPGVFAGSVAWGDFDNDGRLDILLAGFAGIQTTARIYRNNGDGTFSDINAGLAGVNLGTVAWGDYDNDGWLDVLLTGNTGSKDIARIYHNNEDGTFKDIEAGLPGMPFETAAWMYDPNDGRLNVWLTGLTNTLYLTKIYRNNGDGTFTDLHADMGGIPFNAVKWGDYDNDGLVDTLLIGFTGSVYTATVYHNNGDGTFTDINAGLTGVEQGSAAWGDYDSDGCLDILLTGDTGTSYITKVYRNNCYGSFSEISTGLPGVYGSAVAWGDYDNDGRLDILLAGSAGFNLVTRVYRNVTTAANKAPIPPQSLTSVVSNGKVTLNWSQGSDWETPASGLSYNVRIGSLSGDENTVAAMADGSTGLRRIPAMGNAQENLSATLKLKPGTYYWSVQAIDTGYAGSSFAIRRSFTVTSVVYLPIVLRRWPPVPDVPILNSINAPGARSSYTVTWSSSALAISYTLQEAITSSFSGAVTAYSGTATSALIPSRGITTYYYRVKASNQYGDSPWSAMQAVDVRWELEPDNTYTQANRLPASGLTVYGYPNDQKDYYSFDMPAAGTVEVTLTNHTGTAVQLQLFYLTVDQPPVVYDYAPPYHLSYNGQAGRYYVYIYSTGNYNSNSPYTLRVTYPVVH